MITALVSVYEKTGLVDFLKQVKSVTDLQIIATTSTAKYLEENGFSCRKVEDLTGFPEILGGRVKTLHPNVFAGILARSTDADLKCLADYKIPAIDIVICNLYPFEQKLNEKLSQAEMLEYIDIGGVSLLRAAAKNFPRVTVLCQPDQYNRAAQSIQQNKGNVDENLRRQFACESFERTCSYDRKISSYLYNQSNEPKNVKQESLPAAPVINLAHYQSLRYGENPHQAAIWYANKTANGSANGHHNDTFPPFEQLQGKELSSNNIIDTYCLTKILREIGRVINKPVACIIKHNNPCGVAIGTSIEDAYEKAYNTDSLSAFGGVYGFNQKVSPDLANKICEGFVEIVAAPDFDTEALKIFNAKKNLRVLKFKTSLHADPGLGAWKARDLQDFGWILEKETEAPVDFAQFQSVSGGNVPAQSAEDINFAWAVVKQLTSNAIFIVKNGVSLGFGIGQTSRIASVEIALKQAGDTARGAIMASDAFFPATDNIERASQAGISIIVQPGGSVKDKEVIQACEQSGIKMLFTGQRCFKH